MCYPNTEIKLLYCLIDKMTTHRLFEKYNGDNHFLNPPPGTVVSTGLVENENERIFDFFLIPHKATIATARPVHYQVVHNTLAM